MLLVRCAPRSLTFLLAAGLALALAACTGTPGERPALPATATATAPPAAAEPTARSTPTLSAATPPPSPTATPKATETPTPTATATPSPTSTATPSPTATATPTTFRYDTFDPTGAAASPGSYAFLVPDGHATSVVTTYEQLRTEASVMRVNVEDGHGASWAGFYDEVAVGDVVEWRQADDCWARYRVTTAPQPAMGATSRAFGVRWVTYTYTGCGGAVSANGNRTIDWSPPDVRSPDIAVPVRHGPWTLHSPQWTGPVESTLRYPRPSTLPDPDPETPMPFVTTDIAEARSTILLWREPTVPEDWTFSGASMGDPYGYDYGYIASFQTGSGLNHVSIHVFYSEWRPVFEVATGHQYAVQRELRTVDGRPALLIYSPTGPNHDEGYPISIWIFDDATGIQYRVSSHTPELRGSNIEPVIAIARSLLPE